MFQNFLKATKVIFGIFFLKYKIKNQLYVILDLVPNEKGRLRDVRVLDSLAQEQRRQKKERRAGRLGRSLWAQG